MVKQCKVQSEISGKDTNALHVRVGQASSQHPDFDDEHHPKSLIFKASRVLCCMDLGHRESVKY